MYRRAAICSTLVATNCVQQLPADEMLEHKRRYFSLFSKWMWSEEEDWTVMKAEKQNWFPCHHVEKKFYSYSRRCIVLFSSRFFLRNEWAKTEQRVEMKNSTNGFALHWMRTVSTGRTMNCIKTYAFDAVTGNCWHVHWDSVASTGNLQNRKTKRFFHSLKILGDHAAGVFTV